MSLEYIIVSIFFISIVCYFVVESYVENLIKNELDSAIRQINSAQISIQKKLEMYKKDFHVNVFLKNYQKDLNVVRKSINFGFCECGGEFILKHGRYGYFFGCSNYPTCKKAYK